MQRSFLLLVIGALIMALVIAYGFIYGDFFEEAKVLLPSPWFQVALIDLYLGFALFSGWILYREESRIHAVVWIVLLCVLGNFASCIYAAIALTNSKGNMGKFWSGCHATNS